MLKNLAKTTCTKAMALVAATTLLAGCGDSGSSPDAGNRAKTADLVYVNGWAEGVAYTHLAQAILEDEMGYEVRIIAAGVGPGYTAVGKGDMDAFMETWLPILHRDYVNKYEDQLVDLGHVYEGTRSGLVVPAYVPIDMISQLNQHKKKLDGQITGIDAGAGIMKTTDKVIEEYELDLELVPSSGPAMVAALSDAVEDEDWIVVTGWKPHWMFGRWDLKFLEQDEDKMMWETGNIHIMGRLNLEKEKPELAQFLRNMFFTDAQLGDLMLKVKESDEDIETVVRQWMKDNEEVVEAWIPDPAPAE